MLLNFLFSTRLWEDEHLLINVFRFDLFILFIRGFILLLDFLSCLKLAIMVTHVTHPVTFMATSGRRSVGDISTDPIHDRNLLRLVFRNSLALHGASTLRDNTIHSQDLIDIVVLIKVG